MKRLDLLNNVRGRSGGVMVADPADPLNIRLFPTVTHSRAPLYRRRIKTKEEERQSDTYESDKFEPPRDKRTKWHVRPTKTQISLGIRPV